MYWFAYQQQTSTFKRQRFSFFYAKFSAVSLRLREVTYLTEEVYFVYRPIEKKVLIKEVIYWY